MLVANSVTGSQNFPPTRWSWEYSDWASRAAMAGDAWTSGELAALMLDGPWPRSSKRSRWLDSLEIHWASRAAHSGCSE